LLVGCPLRSRRSAVAQRSKQQPDRHRHPPTTRLVLPCRQPGAGRRLLRRAEQVRQHLLPGRPAVHQQRNVLRPRSNLRRAVLPGRQAVPERPVRRLWQHNVRRDALPAGGPMPQRAVLHGHGLRRHLLRQRRGEAGAARAEFSTCIHRCWRAVPATLLNVTQSCAPPHPHSFATPTAAAATAPSLRAAATAARPERSATPSQTPAARPAAPCRAAAAARLVSKFAATPAVSGSTSLPFLILTRPGVRPLHLLLTEL
jgi:hypothetical protein